MKKRITIHNVAKEANVSAASVSLYLNSKPGLADETRKKIGDVVQRLNYIPRKQSRDKDKSFPLISLTVERLPFSMFSELHYGEVLHGMQAEAQALGYNLQLNVVEHDQLPAETVARVTDVSGVVVLGGGDVTASLVSSLVSISLPALLVDVNFPSVSRPYLLVDNIGGGHQATKHLIDEGYMQIACIQGPSKYPSLVERFYGYCLAFIEAKRLLNNSLIQPSISEGFPNKGYREMKALLESERGIDAVFCVSDRAALGAMQALQEAGLKVPQDVAIVGFENVPQSRFTIPPLTTVNVPKDMLGRLAIRRLHQMVKEGDDEHLFKTILPTKLIVRESSSKQPRPEEGG